MTNFNFKVKIKVEGKMHFRIGLMMLYLRLKQDQTIMLHLLVLIIIINYHFYRPNYYFINIVLLYVCHYTQTTAKIIKKSNQSQNGGIIADLFTKDICRYNNLGFSLLNLFHEAQGNVL